MSQDDERAGLRSQEAILRVARIVGPIVVLIVTAIAGARLGAFDRSLSAPVTSPLAAIFFLGLSLFPFGTFLILQGLLARVLARQSKYWPAVKGHTLPRRPFQGLSHRFWYAFDGKRFEGRSIHFGRSAFYAPGEMEIDVYVDPQNPDVTVIAGGDDVARRFVGLGVLTFAAAIVLGALLVWLSS